MIDVSSELRRAYLSQLNGINVEGKDIPVFDEIVNPTRVLPSVMGANSCYILITDQSETEMTGTMCGDRENANITIQVVSKYNSGYGGKRLTEIISGEIQSRVRDRSFVHNLAVNGFIVNRITKVISQSVVENNETETAYTKNIIYQNLIKL